LRIYKRIYKINAEMSYKNRNIENKKQESSFKWQIICYKYRKLGHLSEITEKKTKKEMITKEEKEI
jgi:hypothetical protein